MPAPAVEPKFHTSGLIRLTRPQMFATMTGLLLALLLAALDQTIVGTAEPRIIAQLSGFDRYPWVSTTVLAQAPRWRFRSSRNYPTCTAENGFSWEGR